MKKPVAKKQESIYTILESFNKVSNLPVANPKQKPGDQLKGTDKLMGFLKNKGNPYGGKLVGEEKIGEDLVSAFAQQFADYVKGKAEVDETEDDMGGDWGTSDWTPVLKAMDEHLAAAGRINPETIEAAALEAAYSWGKQMGYDSYDDAANAIVGTWMRRKGFAAMFAPSMQTESAKLNPKQQKILDKKLAAKKERIDAQKEQDKKDRADKISKKKVSEGNDPAKMAALRRQYRSNESNNRHSENIVLLAKCFGSPEELSMAQQAVKYRDQVGGFSYSDHRARNYMEFQRKINDKYYPLLRQQSVGESKLSESRSIASRQKKLVEGPLSGHAQPVGQGLADPKNAAMFKTQSNKMASTLGVQPTQLATSLSAASTGKTDPAAAKTLAPLANNIAAAMQDPVTGQKINQALQQQNINMKQVTAAGRPLMQDVNDVDAESSKPSRGMEQAKEFLDGQEDIIGYEGEDWFVDEDGNIAANSSATAGKILRTINKSGKFPSQAVILNRSGDSVVIGFDALDNSEVVLRTKIGPDNNQGVKVEVKTDSSGTHFLYLNGKRSIRTFDKLGHVKRYIKELEKQLSTFASAGRGIPGDDE